MQHLHTEEQEQTSMDATTTTIRAALIMSAAITFMSCTATQQPEPPAETTEPIEFTGYDMTDNAGKALQNLHVFLQSVTTTTRVPVPEYRNTTPADQNVWDELAQCETGGNWSANTGNGFGGGLQFAHQHSWSTWNAYGGEQYAPHPWEASREQQIEVATQVLNTSGWGAWPGCARKLGLR